MKYEEELNDVSEIFLETKNDKQLETWDDFGNNLKSFIESNKDGLIEDSFDVILGFSRGGTILAFAFASLLKDNLPEYSGPVKASVRPIPKGITCKTNDPCYVMDHPTSQQEVIDIKDFLRQDIKQYAKDHNNNKPINILIMDDNLTGATRVSFLQDELSKMKDCVKSFKTLAYVRHPAFLSMPTIRDFPEGKDIFVMPWHEPHDKKDLIHEEIGEYKLKIFVKDDNGINFEDFKKEFNYFYGLKGNFLINGASSFYLTKTEKDADDFFELNFVQNKFYPPKQCLKSEKEKENSDSNYDYIEKKMIPFCSFDASITMGVCLTCSCINCNKRLLEKAFDVLKSQTIKVEVVFDEIDKTNLKPAIKKWFMNSFPNIKLLDS